MTEISRQPGAAPELGLEDDVILLAAVLDDAENQVPALPPLAEQEGAVEPEALPKAPIETAAGPGGAPSGSGGSSQYNSDFGNLIARLQASGGGESAAGSTTPQGFFVPGFSEDDP